MGQQTRTHRERQQPHNRSKFGLLEKKKDYKLRANNFHQKEDALKNLEKKAVTRNPNEFYFKMTSIKKSSKGKLLTEDHTLSADMIKLMKTQDRQYIAMLIQKELSQLNKLKNRVQIPFRGQRIIFNSDENVEIPAADMKQSDPERELENRQNRLQELQLVLGKMALEHQLSNSKGSRSKEELDDGTVLFKWRNERSK